MSSISSQFSKSGSSKDEDTTVILDKKVVKLLRPVHIKQNNKSGSKVISSDNVIMKYTCLLPHFSIFQTSSDVTVGSQTFPALAPTIALLDNYSTLVSLYDQYRITKLEYLIFPMVNANGTGPEIASASINCFSFLTAVDYDDGNNPASMAVLRSYQTCETHNPYKVVKRVLQPCVAVSTSGSGFEIKRSPWLDAATSGVSHYGLKIGINSNGNTAATLLAWSVHCRVYTEWKNTR